MSKRISVMALGLAVFAAALFGAVMYYDYQQGPMDGQGTGPPTLGQQIFIEDQPNPNKPDPEAILEQINQGIDEGKDIPDQRAILVNVNGKTGVGVGSGYSVFETIETPRHGFVSWWANGTDYTVFGIEGRDGTSLEALLEIAEEVDRAESAQ